MEKTKDWSSWPESYYAPADREERLEILKERLKSGEADEKDQLRMKFWKLRYETRDKMPRGVDYLIRSWMELYFISRKPGNRWAKKQQAKDLEQVKQDLGFSLAREYGSMGEEVLYQELCNGIRLYIQLCQQDSKYNSQLLGIMKLKPEKLVEKIGNEFWKISTVVPESFGQEEAFRVFKKACEDTFWAAYPKYKKDMEIKLGR